MARISIRIPQIGEGLQEARLVATLKSPGDSVARDEPLYQMETDKAVMDVESPFEGVLVEWTAAPDDIVPIGGVVATMEVEGAPEESAPPQAPAEAPPTALLNAPPRTRAYAKEKGVSEAVLAELGAGGKKVMPEDVDAYLAGSGSGSFADRKLTAKQRLLASRLARGHALVVPGTLSVPLNWEPIERERTRVKNSDAEFKPSAFTMFAFAVAAALREFPAFRSTLVGDDTLRTYAHAALGIAVALPDDELVIAVVEDADALDWREFAERAKARIELARSGKDQANEAVTVSLTNMQSFGLRDAVPVVVSPAAATIFLGAAYLGFDSDAAEGDRPKRLANLVMTFDHRLVNGVGAAEFANAIKRRVETISTLVGGA